MRLQHLQLILAIAETGSLRAAAQQLHVTQPALTKALRQLEEEFGTPLVLRTPRGARLAPTGELLATRAATALREIERAREEVDWHLRHAEARVTVGVSPAAALMLLPGALARVRARWPQVRVLVLDAVYPRALTMVRSGEIDLCVGPLPPDGAGRDLRVAAMFDAQQVLIARAGHPLAQAKRLEQLQHADWVLTGPSGGPGDPLHLGFEARGLARPPVVLTCESFTTLLALMTSVDVIGISPAGYYARVASKMGIVRLPMLDPLPRVTLHAVWRADVPLPPPTARLLDALEHEARLVRGESRLDAKARLATR